jgi:ABC-type sugar transport system ATPase subunit
LSIYSERRVLILASPSYAIITAMTAQNIPQDDIALEVRNIKKTFPGVVALEDVSISIRRGEVHGLVGKNGAGKSTLIKIISGIYTPDEGQIYFDGNIYNDLKPAEARAVGIQVVPQEQQFQPHLNVAENMFVGMWPTTNLGFIKFKEIEKLTEEALAKLNINISVYKLAKDLTLVQRQIIAIARAIFLNARLIILDEPTPALTISETKMLFQFVRQLASKGITCIYISHYLNEVFEVCDRVSVVRDGRLIHTGNVAELTTHQLIEYMIGKTVENAVDRQYKKGDVILELKNLNSAGTFSDISFSIRKGEIVGLTGLMGCGSFELAKSLFGLFPLDSGALFIEGKPVKILSPEKALAHGVALIPEDRRALGLVAGLSVDANITLSNLKRLTNKSGFIIEKKLKEIAQRYVSLIRISTPSLNQEVRFLSGGNQQKVVVSRLLNTDPKILVIMDPTAGIDVEAKAEIHRLINELTGEGLSILLLSTDLDELLNLSDRVLVMHQGRLVQEFPREDASKQNILVASEGIAV